MRAAKIAREVAPDGEMHADLEVVADVRGEIFDGELGVDDFARVENIIWLGDEPAR